MIVTPEKTIFGLTVTPLAKIATEGGDVQHFMRSDSLGYVGFSEVYFSQVLKAAVKAWKRHHRMTLNLVVPIGKVRFIFWNQKLNLFHEEIIGEENYVRLTVEPGVWFGFQGVGYGTNLVANFADILHDPKEVDKLGIDMVPFKW